VGNRVGPSLSPSAAELQAAAGFEHVGSIADRVMGQLLERQRLQVAQVPPRPLRGVRLALVNLATWIAWRFWDLAEALRQGSPRG